eukprot:gnl/TRDRNA2_/TRDRNA2_150601_c1_seq2.p1 gnl/TRDRNA2_/TRDRNA2_150601_c1~~gnl/TRDRNA2_/TRDRNA2_150601_c1_seq2.p1  ORF type:complete len:103 (-),score=8.25 gnl/TRDRNA2_/TRDRNA2_150601_c1_seq2:43-351(-)
MQAAAADVFPERRVAAVALADFEAHASQLSLPPPSSCRWTSCPLSPSCPSCPFFEPPPPQHLPSRFSLLGLLMLHLETKNSWGLQLALAAWWFHRGFVSRVR